MISGFLDSAPARRSARTLRSRAARDGYLFFRGLLPPEPLLAARRGILAVCARHGFLKAGTSPDDAEAAPGVRCREGEPRYMAAYDEIQRLESFHALAHEAPLLEVLERLLGEPVLVHPRNIARVMFPNNTMHTTPPHQDFVHIQGAEETYTAWIPLGDCPEELGGLEVLAGSHRHGVLPVRAAAGAGGLGVDTDHLGLAWRGGPFRLGDVLLFHSHCVHRAAENRTAGRLRLSVDYRYQPLSAPITAGSLLPHFNRLSWDEIYAGWTRRDLQYYWTRRDLRLVDWTRRYHESAGR